MAGPPDQRRKPNMHDVAKLAGVSQRTVSNVVREAPHVSPQMRERVQAAIKELGYRPNVAAQRLRQGRSGIIGLAVPGLTWPYFSDIAHLVQRAAMRSGRTLLVAETEGNAEYERHVLNGFRANVIDGLILSSIELGADDLQEMDLGIPVVLLGERIRDVGLLHLSIDNVLGAQQMASHLWEQGARTFHMLGATETVMTSSAGALRLRGFTSRFAELGASPEDCRVIPVSPWTQEGAHEAMLAELRRGPLPDAIVCMNDLLAFGALRACRELGINVPDDVLVSGWDDIALASFSAPSLTTIAPDKEQIVNGAVEGLVALIEGHEVDTSDVIVPHDLVVRESTSRISR